MSNDSWEYELGAGKWQLGVYICQPLQNEFGLVVQIKDHNVDMIMIWKTKITFSFTIAQFDIESHTKSMLDGNAKG